MRLSPVKAIRKFCVQCMGGQTREVKKCTAKKCPLYFFRMGKNPNRAGMGGRPKSTPISAQNHREAKTTAPKG